MTDVDADAVYDRIVDWAAGRDLELYPHQDEAVIELLSGNNVVLATPTGSGKSLVAIGAHMAAMADDRVSFYTAPIKALVSEKFFDLCEVFGADDVGLLTGDAAGQRRCADHLLHRGGAGQHRAPRRGEGRRRHGDHG